MSMKSFMLQDLIQPCEESQEAASKNSWREWMGVEPTADSCSLPTDRF